MVWGTNLLLLAGVRPGPGLGLEGGAQGRRGARRGGRLRPPARGGRVPRRLGGRRRRHGERGGLSRSQPERSGAARGARRAGRRRGARGRGATADGARAARRGAARDPGAATRTTLARRHSQNAEGVAKGSFLYGQDRRPVTARPHPRGTGSMVGMRAVGGGYRGSRGRVPGSPGRDEPPEPALCAPRAPQAPQARPPGRVRVFKTRQEAQGEVRDRWTSTHRWAAAAAAAAGLCVAGASPGSGI